MHPRVPCLCPGPCRPHRLHPDVCSLGVPLRGHGAVPCLQPPSALFRAHLLVGLPGPSLQRPDPPPPLSFGLWSGTKLLSPALSSSPGPSSHSTWLRNHCLEQPTAPAGGRPLEVEPKAAWIVIATDGWTLRQPPSLQSCSKSSRISVRLALLSLGRLRPLPMGPLPGHVPRPQRQRPLLGSPTPRLDPSLAPSFNIRGLQGPYLPPLLFFLRSCLFLTASLLPVIGRVLRPDSPLQLPTQANSHFKP